MVENNVKCSYILQYPKREESLVFFSVRCNGMTTKVSTKQVVKTEMWDKKNIFVIHREKNSRTERIVQQQRPIPS